MAIRRRSLDEVLQDRGLSADGLADVRKQAEKSGISMLDSVQRSELSQIAVTRALADLTGLPVIEEIDLEAIDIELVRRIPLGLAREQQILPLWLDAKGRVVAGIASPACLPSADDLRVVLGRPVDPVLVPANVLKDAINKSFDRAARSASAVMSEIEEEQDDISGDLSLEEDILDDPNQAPIIRFVNTLLTQAIKDRASDIHIEPFEKELLVRFRIDGVLYEIVKPPPRLQASIVSRIKIMAGLNIAEKRIPQDGRIRIRMAGREVDLRVSTLPVRYGERVVMRILEKGQVFSLNGIGMSQENLDIFREYIAKEIGRASCRERV